MIITKIVLIKNVRVNILWKIDTRIEPHPISKEDYDKIATPFVQEVIDTGIKVA